MPCGKESEESLQNKRIERELKAAAPKVQQEIKLLLLGTGESGKSTIAKQMKIMHLNGFSPKERETYKAIVHSNIVESISTLVVQSRQFGYEIQEALVPVADRFVTLPADISVFVNAETARGIAELWRDPAIQQAYERKSEYQLPGSVDHIMQHVERLLTPNVELTEDDILRCRMRTTGIIEIEFSVNGADFRMVDVGGQRSERKKWFHCFAQVTAVIFCVALNEYDEKLYEDERVNRMVEALTLFDEVANSKFFNDPIHNTHIILFLNKSDLFKEKIKRVPLTTLFPRHKGGDDFEAGHKYIKKKFLEKSKDTKKLIFTHVTCATDTENVRHVFTAVQTSILNNNLRGVGLM